MARTRTSSWRARIRSCRRRGLPIVDGLRTCGRGELEGFALGIPSISGGGRISPKRDKVARLVPPELIPAFLEASSNRPESWPGVAPGPRELRLLACPEAIRLPSWLGHWQSSRSISLRFTLYIVSPRNAYVRASPHQLAAFHFLWPGSRLKSFVKATTLSTGDQRCLLMCAGDNAGPTPRY